MNIKERALDLIVEPSTWRGAINVATAFGVAISPELAAKIIAIGLFASGCIGVLCRDKKKVKA